MGIGGGRAECVGHGAGIDEGAAQRPGVGADVHEIVGGAHDFFVVFHHHEGVADVAQSVEDSDESPGVAGVQSDAGFVEHVEGSDEA